MTELRIARSMDEIDPAQLDAFGDVLFSHGFHRFAEAEFGARAELHHLVGRDAFAPAYVQREPIPLTFDTAAFLDDASLLPPRILLVHTPYRLRSDVCGAEGELLAASVAHLERHARAIGVRVIVWPFVMRTQGALGDALARGGFVAAFHEADFHLDVDASSYEAFFASLPDGVRKRMRYDRNVMARHGIRIREIPDPASASAAVLRLHGQLMRKYRRGALEFGEQTLQRLGAFVPGTTLLGAFRGEELLGWALGIHDRTTYHVLRCGQDYDELQRASVYFNLVFGASVRKAVELGCRRVSFGKAAHRAKLLRGCRYVRADAWLKFLDPDEQHSRTEEIARTGARREAAFDESVRFAEKER